MTNNVVNNPTTAPTLSPVSGSSTVTTVYVVITYVDQYTNSIGNGNGETISSPQNSLTISTSQQVQVTSPSPPPSGNTVGYNVYASSTSGGPYYLQNTSGYVTIGNTFTIPGTLVTSSRQPPVVNTTGGLTGTLTIAMRGANGTTKQPWGAGNTVKEYQPGIGVYGGGDDIVWVECDGSNSLRVFYLQEIGGTCYSILGGRWELLPGYGQRFLQTGFIAGTLTQSVTVKAVQLAGFSPPADGNGVIWLLQNANLEWTGGAAWPQSGSYNDGTNGYFLTNNSSGGSYGAVNFRSLILTASTSPLPWPVPLQNSWPVNADLLLVEGPSAGYATGRYRQIQMVSPGALGFFGAAPVGQQNTTGTTAGFTAGSGTAMNNASTSTGGLGSTAYTFGDLVRALKRLGLLQT